MVLFYVSKTSIELITIEPKNCHLSPIFSFSHHCYYATSQVKTQEGNRKLALTKGQTLRHNFSRRVLLLFHLCCRLLQKVFDHFLNTITLLLLLSQFIDYTLMPFSELLDTRTAPQSNHLVIS